MSNRARDEASYRAWHEQNRRSWNVATRVHNEHKQDQARFLREGGSTLFPEELALLGELRGKRVVHLQCNSGQDSLSLAALGADVVGVDISDEAIDFARGLSRDSGIAARFERADVFDWLEETAETAETADTADTAVAGFDIVFSSYGAIGWLCDLDRWARGVRRVLRPGGRLVIMEFHPLAWSLGADGLVGDDYFAAGAIEESTGVSDYINEALAPSGYVASEGFHNPERAFGFQWTVADTVQRTIDAGLVLETLREYAYSNGCELFPGMRSLPGRRYSMPEGMPSMPLMLGVSAKRPA